VIWGQREDEYFRLRILTRMSRTAASDLPVGLKHYVAVRFVPLTELTRPAGQFRGLTPRSVRRVPPHFRDDHQCQGDKALVLVGSGNIVFAADEAGSPT
jgi:hypothetical protein